MIVTIFGATGMVGQELVRHCKANDYTVRAFGRNIESMIDEDLRDDTFEAIKGSVFDAADVLNAVTGADAVLTALGGAIDGADVTRSLGIKNIVAQMDIAGVKRIVSVGSVSILNVDDDTMLLHTPDYPQEFAAVGLEHLKAYETLAASDLDWTVVCPPHIIPKAATGSYQTKMIYQNDSVEVNAGNLAMFMVQELSKNEFVKMRVGISNS